MDVVPVDMQPCMDALVQYLVVIRASQNKDLL